MGGIELLEEAGYLTSFVNDLLDARLKKDFIELRTYTCKVQSRA